MKKNRFFQKRIPIDENGMALVSTLALLLALSAFAVIVIQMTATEVDRTSRYMKTRAAFYLAEAGVQRAINQMNYDVSGNSPGDAGNGFSDELTGGLGLSSVSLGSGTYTVIIADNNDNDGNPGVDADSSIILTSTGTSNGVSTTVEAVVYRPLFQPQRAITVNGNMEMPGNPTVSGTCGSVHANGDVQINGSPNISQDVTAVGTYSENGSPTIGGMASGGEPTAYIPDMNPADFQVFANYTLASDGKVYDSNGNMIHDTNTSGQWNGWQHNPPEWRLGGNTGFDAMLYVEGDANVAGNPGSVSTPWQTTIVATGNIRIDGNPVFVNYQNPAHPPNIQNLFLIAGLDLRMNGNSNQNINGFMYAREQVDVAGNPNINGFIMALDGSATSGLVTLNDFAGNMNMTFDCNMTMPAFGDKVAVLSWEEK